MGIIAFDDADDVVYDDGWQNADNGGSGWTGWLIPAPGETGGTYAVADSNLNGTPTIGPGINSPEEDRAWVLNALTTDGVVERNFPRNATAGDYFCLEYDPSADGNESQNIYIFNGDFDTATEWRCRVYDDGGTFWIVDAATTDTEFAVNSGGFHFQWAWITDDTYILTITRYSDNAVYTSSTRTFLGTSQANSFAVSNNLSESPTDSLYINSCTFADSSGGYSGCAGDPHFVDFDGKRFDFHGEPDNHYLLFDSKSVRLEALFQLEPKVAHVPELKNATFISQIKCVINGVTRIYDAYDSTRIYQTKNVIEGNTGLVRGIPQEFKYIGGVCVGGDIIKTNLGEIIISLFDIGYGGAKHLNVSMKLNRFVPATGILGQTVLPLKHRKPNEVFKC